jgi:hypothetical protein
MLDWSLFEDIDWVKATTIISNICVALGVTVAAVEYVRKGSELSRERFKTTLEIMEKSSTTKSLSVLNGLPSRMEEAEKLLDPFRPDTGIYFHVVVSQLHREIHSVVDDVIGDTARYLHCINLEICDEALIAEEACPDFMSITRKLGDITPKLNNYYTEGRANYFSTRYGSNELIERFFRFCFEENPEVVKES